MKISKRQLKRIIKEEKNRIIFERRLLKENPLGLLAGAGLLIAVGTRGGRSLIAKTLRTTGNIFDKLETIDDRMAQAMGIEHTKGAQVLDAMTEIVAEMMPNRMLLDELADLLEGMTDDEGAALNDALAPVKATTPVGRLAAAGEAAGKLEG